MILKTLQHVLSPFLVLFSGD